MRVALLQHAHALDPGHTGQTDIQQGHVRQILSHPGQSIFHGPESAGRAKAFGAIDQRHQSFADLLVIFDNGHLDGTGCGWHMTVA